MVVNFGHVVFAQIRQLVGNVNNKNSKATSAEIQQVLMPHIVHRRGSVLRRECRARCAPQRGCWARGASQRGG